jgi:hypothetical protein
MKKHNQPLTPWFLATAVAVLLAGATTAPAGLLQIQNNPVSFGNLYWGNPTNWDTLGIPRYPSDTPSDGTHNRDLNFISVAHDNYYFYVRVNFNQAPGFNGSDFYFWLDTDLNAATGTRDFSGNGAIGSEYVIVGATVIQDPAAWNFGGWINWDQNPWTSGDLSRDVIFSLDRSTQLPGVKSFNFTYQLYNSTDGVTGDWYPDSADTQSGDFFQYTTAEIAGPSPTSGSDKYSKIVTSHGPLAYYRLDETATAAPDIATNNGSIAGVGNGVYTIGAKHPVAGAIAGDPDKAACFSAVNTNSTDGGVPVIVQWPEKPLIRELWDNVGAANLDKKGDGTSSIGFDSTNTWHVNNGRIMKLSPWFDIGTPPGPPYSRGQAGALYADNSDIGGLAHLWDQSAWATRQLASAAQINFAADGEYWITVRIDNAGDTAMGVGFASGGSSPAQFVGVGAMWDNAGGGSANNAVYITDGALGTDTPYTIRANSYAGLINGPGLIVAHLVTSSSGSDTLEATVLQPGDSVPSNPASLTWQTTYSFDSAITATHLLTWLNGDTSGGNGRLDAIRVTTNFDEMFQGELNTAGSFTIEAWLRPTLDGAGNAQSPLFNTDPNGGPSTKAEGWDFYQRGSGTGWNFNLYNGDIASSTVFSVEGGPYTVGQWSHLVAVYNSTNPSVTLYLNGQQAAFSDTPNGTYAPNSHNPLSIGGYGDASQNPFSGDIDEVAIYSNALSAAQVLAHYQNGTNAARSIAYSTLVQTDGAKEYLRLGGPARNVAINSGTLSTNADGVFNVYTTAGHAGPRSPGYTGFESSNAAALFNGGTSYIELRNPAALNFAGQITLEAWVQPSVTPAPPGGFGDIIAHGYDEDFNEIALRVDASSGTQQYSIATFTSGLGQGAFASVPAADLGTGAWAHLVGTFDGADWKLYRNGSLIATAPDTTGSVMVMNGDWAIGARGRWAHMDPLGPGLSRQFQGGIDEPAIYDRALTPAEVLAHYLVGAANGPTITITRSGNSVLLTWPVGTLQQADNVNGPYTDLLSATSPYTTSSTGTKKFYRLKL